MSGIHCLVGNCKSTTYNKTPGVAFISWVFNHHNSLLFRIFNSQTTSEYVVRIKIHTDKTIYYYFLFYVVCSEFNKRKFVF